MIGGSGGDAKITRDTSAILNIVIIALLAICVGVVVLYLLSAKQEETPQQVVQQQPATELVDVLVPVNEIEAGVQLTAAMFRKETRALVTGSTNIVTSFDQLKSTYAASFMAPGQPLLMDYITAKPPLNQIQANIKDGFRAVTMAVDATTNVEGWARAGANVDVMLSPTQGRPTMTIVVQNAKVLSASRSTSGDPGAGPSQPNEKTTITIMVRGEEAAKIQLASESGILSLALRGDEESVASPENSAITIDSILGISTRAPSNEIPIDGRVRVGGKEFKLIGGKLVPEDHPNLAPFGTPAR